MILAIDQFIGVNLGNRAINAGLFSSTGQLHCHVDIQLPLPAMPGAVTVVLCEAIEIIDFNRHAKFVGVCVSGDIDEDGRVTQDSNVFAGWQDVPLAAWLEPRLDRKVVLGNHTNCLHLAESCQNLSKGFDCALLPTIGAARLAFESSSNFLEKTNRDN